MHWQTTRFRIDLRRPRVMGIVNVTPDSFSDGGLHAEHRQRPWRIASGCCARGRRHPGHRRRVDAARRRARRAPDEELRARAAGAARGAARWACRCRWTRSEPAVMREALDARRRHRQRRAALRGAGRRSQARGRASARRRVPDAHAAASRPTMQQAPAYADVVAEVAELPARSGPRGCRPPASRAERIVLDPGHRLRQDADAQPRAAVAAARTADARPAAAGRLVAQVDAGPADRPAGAASAWPPAWRRRWRPCSAARASCACTMWRPRSMRCKVWRAAGRPTPGRPTARRHGQSRRHR